MKLPRLSIILTSVNLLVAIILTYHSHRMHKETARLMDQLKQTEKAANKAEHDAKVAKAACDHLSLIGPEHDL